MKSIIIGAILGVVLVTGYLFYQSEKPATKQQLEDVRKELASKIDSLQRKSDSLLQISKKLDKRTEEFEKSIDTIKKGQIIIYEQVKKENVSIYDLLKSIL